MEVSDGNLTDTIRVTINVTNVDEAGSVALTRHSRWWARS